MSFYPIRVYKVTLCFNAHVSLPFFHQPLVSSFLRTLLNISEAQQNRILIHTPQSGQCDYEAGQHFCFYFITLNLDEHLLAHIVDQFVQLPLSATAAKCHGLLADNLHLVNIEDGLTDAPLANPMHAATLDHGAILSEAEQWQQYAAEQQEISLTFLSPVRLSKPQSKTLYNNGSELTGELILNRCFDAFASLCSTLGLARPTRVDLPATPIKTHLSWVDCSYTNPHGKQKQLGGLVGTVTLNCGALNYDLWVYLVLGQYIGLGQNRNFGMGRYKLVGTQGQSSLPQIKRPTPLLQTVLSYQNLSSAWQHEYKKLSKVQQAQYGPDQLEALHHSIHTSTYQPGYLTPRLLQKPGQKERLLLLPNFIDKVTHKAISLWLSNTLDKLYNKASYGYRTGHSRLNAKYRIQHLLHQGYTTVLDADIKSFFASICTQQVIDKLVALYGDDPLWPLVAQMLNAEIDPNTELQINTPPTGLNLGSALSPVLANLMLDQFDDVISHENLELVRYADDFLILCKSQQQAEHAKTLVQAVLQQQGLSLNPQKTRITTIQQGFNFLGYYFINELVIPIKPQHNESEPVEAVPAPKNNALFFDNAPQVVCITGQVAVLSCQGRRLKIAQQDNVMYLPLAHIDTLILFGSHHITTPALIRLMKKHIHVYFADGFGNFIGQANGAHKLYQQQLIQASVLSQAEQRLCFSQQLISAKIANQMEVLRQRQLNTAPLKHTLEKLQQANSTQQVLGLEGSASKHYFREIASTLPEGFEFTHRQKQQPNDPVNSLLSYGYSMLYAHVDSLVRAQGLNPTLGGLHKTRGQHSALASDLMEPFRFIVERTMLTSIKLGQIKPTDFSQQGKFCQINHDARKRWSQYLIEALQSPKFNQQYSVLDAITCQNSHLINWLNGNAEHFTPWRLK
ncbi:CRISPR-associated endonuclease Cas1 [Pseudoalteromonas sp. T1lg65]|uniref:CRISPR-associated endonuclease Cas1 n=1 Tax=Pseudoalteromonas sp. T1lg65 TaxID=2077101 RepID=UPI003F7949F7